MYRKTFLLIFCSMALVFGASSSLAAPSYLGASVASLQDTFDNKKPNAVTEEIDISWDSRISKRIVYSTRATNLISNTNGEKNIFMISRKHPWGKNGTFWKQGATTLLTKGYNGVSANGDSWSPAVDGATGSKDSAIDPNSIVFVSNASNLVKGDTNNKADVFIYSIKTKKTKRLATKGSAVGVDVDGYGDKLVYSSTTGLYVYDTKTKNTKRLKSAKGITNPHITYKGKAFSFERAGNVYIKQPNRPIQKIARGSNSSIDSGNPKKGTDAAIRSISFTQDGKVYLKHMGKKTQYIAKGNNSRMTSGGGWVAYSAKNFLWLSINSKTPRRVCPDGDMSQVSTSARGNYIAFTCSTGGLYLGYLGPK